MKSNNIQFNVNARLNKIVASLHSEHHQKRGMGGFTIIELLIVVSLVFILSSIAAPNLSSVIKANAASTATNDFINAVAFARGQAMGSKNDVVLCAVVNAQVAAPVCNDQANWSQGWVVRSGTETGDILAIYPVTDEVNITETNAVRSITFARNFGQTDNLELRVFTNEATQATGMQVDVLASGLTEQKKITRTVPDSAGGSESSTTGNSDSYSSSTSEGG